MYQSDRGSYRSKESMLSIFLHSCLGQLVVVGVVLGILLLITFLTCPSERKMQEHVYDDIRQNIEHPDTIRTDWTDVMVSCIAHAFSSEESPVNVQMMNHFNKYNRLEFFDNVFFSTAYVYNNYQPEGVCCAVGVLGIVMPLVNYNAFLLKATPLRKDYLYEIETEEDEEENKQKVDTMLEYGSNPALGGTFDSGFLDDVY